MKYIDEGAVKSQSGSSRGSGLFNLENIYPADDVLNQGSTRPQLLIVNCKFQNFYSTNYSHRYSSLVPIKTGSFGVVHISQSIFQSVYFFDGLVSNYYSLKISQKLPYIIKMNGKEQLISNSNRISSSTLINSTITRYNYLRLHLGEGALLLGLLTLIHVNFHMSYCNISEVYSHMLPILSLISWGIPSVWSWSLKY